MTEAGNIEIRLLDGGDIAGAMRLKTAARWNQTADDWRRLLELDPRGCFAAAVGGRLVGTTTTTAYGRELAWVGMVLVDPEFRRRGIATALVRAALGRLAEVGAAAVKLDATPAGAPVYEALGFEAELRVERWCGVAGSAAEDRVVGVSELSAPAGIFACDRRAFGADRSALLTALIADACVRPLVSVTQGGRVQGYALARRGAEAFYVGPVVAQNAGVAAALLEGMLGQLVGSRVYIDLNTTFAGGAAELAARGFVKQRDLLRMGYGEKSGAGTSPEVFAIAGPEVG